MKAGRVWVLLMLLWVPAWSGAAVQLPSYATGADVKTEAQAVGQRVTETVSLFVGILGIIGLLISAGSFAVGNQSLGRTAGLGSVGGLTLAALAFGIARLFA